jgi:hypothetical protein
VQTTAAWSGPDNKAVQASHAPLNNAERSMASDRGGSSIMIAAHAQKHPFHKVSGMESHPIHRWIKSACGRAKYVELAARQGPLARVRLAWFVLIAALRDWPLPDHPEGSES